MINSYTKNDSTSNRQFKPKKSTLEFLFNYSKSLRIVTVNNNDLKLFLN